MDLLPTVFKEIEPIEQPFFITHLKQKVVPTAANDLQDVSPFFARMNKDRDVGERSSRVWFALLIEGNWLLSSHLEGVFTLLFCSGRSVL